MLKSKGDTRVPNDNYFKGIVMMTSFKFSLRVDPYRTSQSRSTHLIDDGFSLHSIEIGRQLAALSSAYRHSSHVYVVKVEEIIEREFVFSIHANTARAGI